MEIIANFASNICYDMLKIVWKFLLFVSLFGLVEPLFAQTKSFFGNDSRLFVEQGLRYGNYLPFVDRHAYIKKDHVYGVDLRIGKQTDGRKQWEQLFNYPSYGLLLRYEHNTLDSAKYEYRNENGDPMTDWVEIGDCFVVGGFINGHLYNGKYWSLDYDITGGLSFWPKHGNEFIGSLVNVHLAIGAGPVFHISDNFDIFARYMFSHSSNGALLLPNNGVNVLSWTLGMRYYPKDRPVLNPKEPVFWKKQYAIYASESFGVLQSNTKINGQISGEPGYYFGNLIQLGVTGKFHPKFRWSVGLDLSWTGETKLKCQEAAINAESGSLSVPLVQYSFWRGTHIAVSGMFEVLYNNFAFCVGGGYYLYHGIYNGTDEKKTWTFVESKMSPFEKQYLPDAYQNYYERVGFKYYFGKNKNMYAGAFMKLHAGSIDYIEWTYGIHIYSWQGKKECRRRQPREK